MRKYLVPALSVLTVFTGSAIAADLPSREPAVAPAPVQAPVQSYNWTGAYLGIASGLSRHSSNTMVPSAGLAAVPVASTSARWGSALGVTLGYNQQFGSMVAGVEGDVNYTTSGRRKRQYAVAAPGWPGPGVAPFVARHNYNNTRGLLGTARLRVGAAVDRTLLYVTGGLAFRNANRYNGVVVTDATPAIVGNFVATSKRRNIGYAVGAGVEYALGGNWSAKGEYVYHNFGGKNTVLADPANPGLTYTARGTDSIHVLRLGLNYQFASMGNSSVAKY
jgi:outer membrane immunogenic protein